MKPMPSGTNDMETHLLKVKKAYWEQWKMGYTR